MENLGKYLKEFREAQGIDYINVYSDIRLREVQVRMMEENRFFELGPYGVIKATVHNYARYLNADIDAVMRELSILVPEITKNHHQPSRRSKEKNKIMLSTNFLWAIGITLFVALLAGILFHAWKQGWLKAPQILKSGDSIDSLKIKPAAVEKTVEIKPDTTRQRMLRLSKEADNTNSQDNKKTENKPDKTDYVNKFMGDSPVNVETD